MVIIRIFILLIILITVNIAHAGTNFTDISSNIQYVSIEPHWNDDNVSDGSDGGHFVSSSAITFAKNLIYNIKEHHRRRLLLDKINEIQKQFEEAEKASQQGLSQEEIQKIEDEAIRVLTGAMVVCSSEVVR